MAKTPRQDVRPRGFMALLRAFRSDIRGNIAIMSAVLAPVLLGAFGLGTEVVSWYANERSMQSAADSAVIAAASNGGSDYALEAQAVAMKYGFTNGSGGVTVTALSGQTCPDGTNTCYRVDVSKVTPLLMAQLVGFQGDASLAGQPAKRLNAMAMAIQSSAPRPYCVLALAGSGTSPALRANGAPKADLSGCNVMSNTSADCNGHNLGADIGDAHTSNSGCGVKQNSNVPTVSDPYATLASNIPTPVCAGSYPQLPAKKKDPPLPAVNQFSGARSWSGVVHICGDAQLTGDTTVTTPSGGAVLLIANGRLDTNGYTLRTASGSAVTVIFTGVNDPNYTHTPIGGGTMDITAPNSGVWSGVAIYIDPALTQNVDMSAAGNSPTWDITGLVYMPHSGVTFSGAVNKSSNGLSCFVLVVDNLLINGTGSILSRGQCGQAGLNMPSNAMPSRGKLVS